MSGLLPVRAGSDGALPLPGEPREADWHGWIDIAQLPAVLQSRRQGKSSRRTTKSIASLPYLVTRDWAAPFRAQRINELLGDRRGLDIPAMRHIQADITSLSADLILKAIEVPDSLEDLRDVGSPRRSTGRSLDVPRRSKRRYGVGRSPTKCPRRSTIVSIDTRPTSDSPDSTPSSATRGPRGSTIAPRPNVTETRDDIVRQAADDALADSARRASATRRRGDGTRPMPSCSRIRFRAGDVCWTGSSAVARCPLAETA